MPTGMTFKRTHDREQRRAIAFRDRRYLAVGRYDAMLFRAQCPYPPGSEAADEWREGYDGYQAERAARETRSEDSLVSVISTMRAKGER